MKRRGVFTTTKPAGRSDDARSNTYNVFERCSHHHVVST